jgi:hypothetical protein
MFNGIEIPGIQFQNQKTNDETIQYNDKSSNNQIRTTDDEQLYTIQLIMGII